VFGAEAASLIAEGKHGWVVTFQGAGVASVEMAEAVGRLETVPLDGGFVRTARALGICLGD
jgi:6-phosphofructokinase 1